MAYGGNGKLHLIKHCNSVKHIEVLKTRSGNFTLGASFKKSETDRSTSRSTTSTTTPFSIFNTKKSTTAIVGSGTVAGPSSYTASSESLIPFSDRTANTEAMILGFIAENSLPVSIASSLTDLIKEVSRDPKALVKVALSKQIAINKMNYGLAKTFTATIVDKLKSTPFSLNIDEASSDHGKKILSMIVSFFDEDIGAVAIHHLASVELVKTDAQSIYKAIAGVIEGKGILWDNLVSVLLDSCNTMRAQNQELNSC